MSNTTTETMFNTTADKMPYTESMGDSTAWITANPLADFLLMHSSEIKYLCMLAYTVLHGTNKPVKRYLVSFLPPRKAHSCLFLLTGCKIFGSFKEDTPMSYKFVRLVFQCTGGGILVPIFINAIPVSLGNDAYPIAIFLSYLVHTYFPVFRDMVANIPALKVSIACLRAC